MESLALVDQKLADFEVSLGQILLLLGEITLDALEVSLFLGDQLKLLVEQVGAFLQPLFLLAEAFTRVLGL